MGAKDVVVAPIATRDAIRLVQRYHYSGTYVRNSCLHLGAFIGGKCEGVMSFGPPMDKSKVLHLVRDTRWHNMLELNRLAFSDVLPRNSESRCLAVARRLIARQYPHIEWILSFADATQCGDGTIYRAAGFDLTGIRPNGSLWRFPNGQVMTKLSITAHWHRPVVADLCCGLDIPHRYRPLGEWVKLGAQPLPGFQLRYIWSRDQSVRDRLTVPILPVSVIHDAGAGMVRGMPK